MLLECISYKWTPGIGDPTVMGWLTVLAYLATGAFSLVTARQIFAAEPALTLALRIFWIGLCAGLLALAINKQLDLQTLGTAAGRCLAKMQGWYDGRRLVQREFILSLAGVGAVVFLGGLWLSRRRLARYGVLLAGLMGLAMFVLIRATSFHHMDSLINAQIAGARMNWVLELGSLGLVAAGVEIARRGSARRVRAR